MRIEGVIFDLDGTLFDSINDIADANNAMLRMYGFPEHPAEQYIQWVGNGAMRLVKASLPEEASFDDESLNGYLAQYSRIYAENLTVKSKPFRGMNEVLDFLVEQDIPFAINTNKPQVHTDRIVEMCFAEWNFGQVIAQVSERHRKPDPAGALHIARHFGIKPANVVYIGDSIVDIETAKNAGMQSLVVSWGYGNVSNRGDINLLDEAEEIIDWIKKNREHEN